MIRNEGMFFSRESQYQSANTFRTEVPSLRRESVVTYSPTQIVRAYQERPVAYTSFHEILSPTKQIQVNMRQDTMDDNGVPVCWFAQYVPGQMPFDFLSMPLIPYVEGQHGPSIRSFRPQLGSLSVPKGPVRCQLFPF